MRSKLLTREDVIEGSESLPVFPRVIREILRTVDDPDANVKLLVRHIGRDPVITARVLSLANSAALAHGGPPIGDTRTAVSLIGMRNVREMAVLSSIRGFVHDVRYAGMAAGFWQHSVTVGVCSEELALHATVPVSAAAGLVAGLLHDMGQLWLFRYSADAFRATWSDALTHSTGIEEAERERFGIDHSTIGAWLAEDWGLPAGIVGAIRHHHAPEEAAAEPLVAAVHVAEVLSNALDLNGRTENRVSSLSSAACNTLNLVWNEQSQPLFGRMEARSRYASAFY